MKKLWFRRTIKFITAAALLIIILFLSLAFLGKQYVFNRILYSLNNSDANLRIEASLIDMSYFQGSLTLENLTVQSKEKLTQESPPFFHAARVAARIDVTKALRGVWKIEELTLVRPEVYYFTDVEGRNNLPGSSSSSSSESLPDLLIAHAEIRDGAFIFEEQQQNISARLPRWNATITGDEKTRFHHMTFEELEPAGFQYGAFDLPMQIFKFTADLNLPKGLLTIPSARIATEEAAIDIHGSFDFSQPLSSWDVEVSPDLELRRIAQIAKLEEPLAGKVAGTIRITGNIDRLDISTQLNGVDLEISDRKTSTLTLEFQSQWLRDSGKLLFPNFDVSSPRGNITGKADLITPGTTGANSVAVTIKNLDLGPLGELVGTSFDLSSRADGNVNLQWEGSFEKLDLAQATAGAELDLRADETNVSNNRNIARLPLSGRLQATLRKNTLEIKIPFLQTMGLETTGWISFPNFQDIAGEVDGSSTDVGLTVPLVARLLGTDELPSAVKDLEGPVRFHIQAGGSLKQPELSATMETQHLAYGKLTDVGIQSNLLWRESRLEFDSDLRLPQNSTVAAKGMLSFAEDDPALTLEFGAERVSADMVNDFVDRRIPVSGTLYAVASLHGPLSHLAGNAHLRGDNLSVYEEPLGDLRAELTLVDNEIRSNNFRLQRTPDNTADTFDAQFSYALDSGRYEITALGKDLTLHNRNLLSERIPFPEKINLEISGRGTLEEPQLHARLETDELYIDLGMQEETSLGPISASMDLLGENVAVEATVPHLKITAHANTSLRAPYPFAGTINADHSDLELMGLKLQDGQLFGGSLAAVIRGSGNLDEIERTELVAEIQELLLKVGNQETRLFSPTRMKYHNNVLDIPSPLLMVAKSSQLELSGRIPLRETDTEEISKLRGRLDLSDALAFARLPEGSDGPAITGVVNLDLDVNVMRRVFSGSGEISIERGLVEIPGSPLPLTNINASASVENGAFILREASAKWGEGDISLIGEMPFSALPQPVPGLIARDGPVQFNLTVTGLTPEMTGILPPELTGRVSLRAEGSAAKADPRLLRAKIVFDELGIKLGTLDFYQQQPTTLEIVDGIARISYLTMIGPETNVQLSGSADIFKESTDEDALDMKLEGYLDAALLTFADPDLKAAGRLDVQATMNGTFTDPLFSGYAETNNGRVSINTPRIVADDLHVRLELSPGKIAVERFSGLLNGGSLTGEGSLDYRRGLFSDIDLRATFQDFFLEAPEGLKSASNGTITITSEEDAVVIGGNVRVMESSYRESFEVGGQVMNYLKSQQVVIPDATPNSLLNRIRYNISVRTTTPLLVQNNMVRVEATTSNLRIVGTYYEPSVTGRVTLAEGGEIILSQREYYLDRGVITFTNQTHVRPELDIQAQTKVANYEITLQLAGDPDRLTTTFVSEPSLPERDIFSLLVTGRTSAETQGREMQVMQTQALALLAGQAGEQLTGEARKALHLSTFRIDPGELIASESDPGARLTIGEDITRDFSLAYSMNLVNGGDQIWAAQYALPRRLVTQATKQQDNTYRFEFRHDIRFGGEGRTGTGTRSKPQSVNQGGETGPNAAGTSGASRSRQNSSSTKFEIGKIHFTGEESFSQKTLLDQLKAKPGDRYDFSRIQKGLDRLHEFYVKENRLEADIRLRRETEDAMVNLEFAIQPGPVVHFIFEGFPVSEKTRTAVRQAWINGVFEAGRVDDAVAALRRALVKDGYYEAQITPALEKGDDLNIRTIRFLVEPGVRYADVAVRFPGAAQIGEAELRKAVGSAGLDLDVYVSSRKVVDYLQSYYRERGYLEARIMSPQPLLNPQTRTGEFAVEVREGPQFVIGDLEFSGNYAFDYDELWIAIPTSSGSSYDPNTLRNAIRAIENLYHSQGYNEVSVMFRVIQDTPNALAHLTFQITERRQGFIEDVVIEGNRRNSLHFVTRQLDFQKGDILDFEKINESRRRLYATGAFSSVDFQTEEIAENNGSEDNSSTSESNHKSMRVRLRLRDNTPYRMQYGLFYDTERGPGGLLEMQNMNVMGRASNLGFRLRYDADLKEGRVYYNQPFVRMLHLKMDASAFWQSEERAAYSARRIGFSLMQERSLPREYRLDYGYRYDHVRWEPEDVALNPIIFQANVPVARLTATLTRDTRDNVLDATKGEFTAHTLEFGPTWLGSEIGFARYSGQYFRYVPLDKYLKLKTKDDEGNPVPTRLVYAGAMRLGLTSSFGGRALISPERFFAGGGTTMRGFEQDLLGPAELQADGSLRPKGGEGLFLFNNEIRFPIWSIFHGVGFLDIGNVYPRIGDFDFSLRKTAGAGLRLKIKFIPLRFDYGFKLDRRPGESGSAFFFSIGQAF